MSNWSGSDIPSIALEFFDVNSNLILATDTTYCTQTVWTHVNKESGIPAGTRYIKYIMMGERVSGSDNDSYIDDCYLKINLDADSCSYYISDSSSTIFYESELLNLRLYPNPFSNIAMINIPYNETNHLSIRIISVEGKKIQEYNHVHPPTFILNKGDMKNGIYFMQIFNKENIIGQVKFSVIE